MELLSFPLVGKQIFIFIICVLFLFGFLWLRYNLCWKHGRVLRLQAFIDGDHKYCESCMEEALNPRIICSCGWKGHLNDADLYSNDDDRNHIYYCPDCEKEVKFGN